MTKIAFHIVGHMISNINIDLCAMFLNLMTEEKKNEREKASNVESPSCEHFHDSVNSIEQSQKIYVTRK